jgi:drug/metabolite transporter (DMT)-like permease
MLEPSRAARHRFARRRAAAAPLKLAAPMSSAPPSPSSQRLFTAPVVAALATVYLVWGSTYFAMRVALVSFPPFLQGGLRFVIAGVALFAFQRARGAPWPTLREWRDGTIVGVLLLAFGNGGVVYAEQYVSSSVAAIFIGAAPLAAALWSGCFGVWPGPVQWVGILAGFGGVVLLARGAQLEAAPVGIVALTIADLCWTLGSVLAQRRLKLAPGPIGFATEMIAGGVVMMIVAMARGEMPPFVAGWPPTTAAGLAFVYLVCAGSLGAFTAYMFLLSRVPSTIAISYAYVNPLIAVLIGVAFGGEILTSREGWATAIIVGSVVLLTQERRAPTPPHVEA